MTKKTDNVIQVAQHNTLARAKFGLDTLEAKIFTQMLAGVDRKDTEFKDTYIRMSDLVNYGLGGATYKQLDKACRKLVGKTINAEPDKKIGADYYPIFANIKIVSGSGGYIKGRFSEDVKPYLLDLKAHFSLGDISKLMELEDGNTHRLFWFLKSYAYEKQVEITPDELKAIVLGETVDTKKKMRYYDFKTRVLDDSLDELREKNLIDVTYTENRYRNSVTAIVFHISTKDENKALPAPSSKPDLFNQPPVADTSSLDNEQRTLFNKMVKNGFTEIQAMETVDKLVKTGKYDSLYLTLYVHQEVTESSNAVGLVFSNLIKAWEKGFKLKLSPTTLQTWKLKQHSKR